MEHEPDRPGDQRCDSTASIIEAVDLGKKFVTPGGELWVFRHLNFVLRATEMVCLSGPSGSGKTSLLSLLAGLEGPTEGTVALLGQSLGKLSEARAAVLRRKAVGFVFQFFYLMPNLTVLENIALPLVASGSSRDALTLARELATALGLGNRLSHYPRQLSGGEQQRTAIARAVIASPGVIMADEPTGNLDARSAAGVLALLRQQTREGRAVLVASHSPRVAEISDRVVDLGGARLEEVLAP